MPFCFESLFTFSTLTPASSAKNKSNLILSVSQSRSVGASSEDLVGGVLDTENTEIQQSQVDLIEKKCETLNIKLDLFLELTFLTLQTLLAT